MATVTIQSAQTKETATIDTAKIVNNKHFYVRQTQSGTTYVSRRGGHAGSGDLFKTSESHVELTNGMFEQLKREFSV